MAITTLCTEISQSQTYPKFTTISAPNNCGTIVLQYEGQYTEQMVYELPNITINVWVEENGNLVLFTSRAITMGVPKEPIEIGDVITDIPESCIFSLTPGFDNNAFCSHNEGVITSGDGEMWTIPTQTFPLKVLFDDTNVVSGGGSGGGGSDIPIDTQVDPTSENPVQNKAIYSFVNSSVATNTAYFVGTFKSLADLQAVTPITNNDYGFVIEVESAVLTSEEPSDWSTNWTDYYTYSSGSYIPVTGDVAPTWVANTYYKADGVVYNRYKYNGETETWMFEYALNNSSYTAAEWATIQSGLTAADKTQIQTNTTNITNLQTNKQDNITAGTGLTFGTGADINKLNHSNSTTAKTTQAIRKTSFDAQGHITGSTELTTAESNAIASGIDSTKVTQIQNNTTKLTGIVSTGNNNIKMGNGITLFIDSTEPTTGVSEGDLGIGF